MAKFAESKLFQDEAAINRLARTNRSMFETVKDWISDMVVKLTGTEEEKFFRNAERLYEKALREVDGTANSNGGRAQYSIVNPRHMSWDDQVKGYLNKDGSIKSSDSLYLGTSGSEINGVSDAPLYIPTGVVNKAMRDPKGSKSGHSLTRKNIAMLKDGIKNAPAVIVNPARNALIYVTANKDSQGRFIIAAFDMDNNLYGENAHRATSIYGHDDIRILFERLPKEATIYAKSKFDETLACKGILRSPELLAHVEFTNDTVTDTESDVKQDFSGESSNAKSYGRGFDDFSKDARRLPTAEDSTSYANTLREMQQPGAWQPKSYADDLAHINELLQNAALSPRDKAYIQEDIADAQRSCDAAMKVIANPRTTSEERARAVRRAIDALDYARQRIDDLGLPATQLGVSTAQDALAEISEKLKPYLLE